MNEQRRNDSMFGGEEHSMKKKPAEEKMLLESDILKNVGQLGKVAKIQFQNIFLYGRKMKIYNKGKIKEMDVYLDNQREKLLWFSTKTKAFLIDLFFTSICLSQEEDLADKSKKDLYFVVKHFEEEIVIIFDSESEKKKYFNLFAVYIEELRSDDPKYFAYFSHVSRVFALDSTKHGNNFHSQNDVLEISNKIGLANKQENKEVLQKCIVRHKVNNKKEIPFFCILEYFKIMFCSRKMQGVFEKYSKEQLGVIKNDPTLILKPIMSIAEFRQFLKSEQRLSDEKILEILREFKEPLSFYDFCYFLYDEKFCSISQREVQNEHHPLTHYFCFSSHNTYLSGNQLTSDCKVSRYSQDLENGIKCVQLDVHNDGNTPIVTHAIKGTGLCKPILFEDVIKEIDRFSEQANLTENSHYPIILSIENHASDENREKMLNIMTKYFGNSLYQLEDNITEFPSLAYLKGRIVVKTSSQYDELRSFKNQSSNFGESRSISEMSASKVEKLGMISALPHFENKRLEEKFSKFQKFKNQCLMKKSKFDSRISVIEQLFIPISSMAKVTTIFKSPDGIKNKKPTPFECTSMTNAKVVKTNKQTLLKYTKESWLRTYPLATEIDSGNYDPAPMLDVGAQIIALNTQTKDYYAWMMYGYFCGGKIAPAGLKGYTLKPHALLPSKEDIIVEPKVEYLLKIEIIESYNMEIKMKFFGLAEDMKKNEKGANQFSFSNINESFIIFNIGESYRDCVATRFLAEGYRILAAKNKNNFLDSGMRVLVNVMLQRK